MRIGKNNLIALLLITVATVAAYSNSLQGEFQFDDSSFITGNPGIRTLSGFSPSSVLRNLNSGNRPVVLLTFALNYAAEGLRVGGYHAVNLLLHLAVMVLVFLFVKQLLDLPPVAEAFGRGRDLKAIAVAGIFALHPLQTESVSYIVQRAEVLASLFYLLCLFCLVRFAVSERRWEQAVTLAAGMACFALGWGSKEIIVTAPVAALLYAAFFLGKRRLVKLALALLPFVAAGLILGIREVIGFGDSAGFRMRGLGQPEYFYTQLRVLVTYLRLVFMPINQNLDYDYPIYRSFFAPAVFFSALFLAAVLCLFAWATRHKGEWKWHIRVAGFGSAWFLVILAPTSSVVPLRDVIYEHRCYLPLVGVLLVTVALLDVACRTVLSSRLFAPRMPASAPAALLIILFIGLAFATYERNRMWETRISLWNDVVRKSPEKPRGYMNLGQALSEGGRYDEAIAVLRKGLTMPAGISVNEGSIYRELGVALFRRGSLDEALRTFMQGMIFSPTDPLLLNDLSIALLDKGDLGQAKEYAALALKHRPQFAEAHNTMGEILLRQGDMKGALDNFLVTAELEPDDPECYWNSAVALEGLGRPKDAYEYYRVYAEKVRDEGQRREAAQRMHALEAKAGL